MKWSYASAATLALSVGCTPLDPDLSVSHDAGCGAAPEAAADATAADAAADAAAPDEDAADATESTDADIDAESEARGSAVEEPEAAVNDGADDGTGEAAIARDATAADAGCSPDLHPYYARSRTGDFDGDGFSDFADHTISTGALTFMRNTRANAFAPIPALQGTTHAGPGWGQAVGDFNGDALDDVLDINGTSGALTIYFNPATGTLPPTGIVPTFRVCLDGTAFGFCQIVVADFNGDGFADIAEYNIRAAMLYVHVDTGTVSSPSFGTQGNNWAVAPLCTGRQGECDVLVGDFDGDKFADLAEFDRRTGALNVYVNTNGGFGSAEPAGSACVGKCGCDLLVGDFNGDKSPSR